MKLPGRPFWIAQVAGWGGYLLVLWLSGLVYLSEPSFAALLENFHFKAVAAAGDSSRASVSGPSTSGSSPRDRRPGGSFSSP
ncbi:MAG: hypothetical protein IPF66_10035 [Holophagales bacterium]|nr:hypothetical protein [Holophagales bacterium]